MCNLSQSQTLSILRYLELPLLKDEHCRLRSQMATIFGVREEVSGDAMLVAPNDLASVAMFMAFHLPSPPPVNNPSPTGSDGFAQLFIDAARIRGGPVTALPARISQAHLAHHQQRPRLQSLLIALILGEEPTVGTEVIPLIEGILGDHFADLARIWLRYGPRIMELVYRLREERRHVLCVIDGSTYSSFTQSYTGRCPCCGLTPSQYASVRHVQYPVGYPVNWVAGVPFVDVFQMSRSVWRGFPMAPTDVVWGPGHLLAHALTNYLEVAHEALLGTAHYTSYLAAMHAVVRSIDSYHCNFSWAETKRIFDHPTFPLPPLPLLVEYWNALKEVHSSWRRPQACPPAPRPPAERFAAACRAAHLIHLRLSPDPETLPPAVHYLFVHLPVVWRQHGGCVGFPRACSDEPGEKSHYTRGQHWAHRSTMTVQNPSTHKSGLCEVVEAAYLNRWIRHWRNVQRQQAPQHGGAAESEDEAPDADPSLDLRPRM